MFDKISDVAERFATSASRRAFMGRRGRDGDARPKGHVKTNHGGGICPPGYIYCFGRCVHWTHIIWCG